MDDTTYDALGQRFGLKSFMDNPAPLPPLTEEEKAANRLNRQKRRELEDRQVMKDRITAMWKRNVPERYWGCNLDTLVPSEKSHMPMERQGNVIKIIKDAPAAGYAFLSPSGWSKSTFLYALYRYALNTNAYDIAMRPYMGRNLNPVNIYEAKTLMDRIQAWKIGDADAPAVTANKIARLKTELGITSGLFLDEFEKVKKSEFRMNEMYDLINACYKHNAQLVIAGNLTKEDLDDKNQYLEGTFRRIEDLTSPHFWEFGGK